MAQWALELGGHCRAGLEAAAGRAPSQALPRLVTFLVSLASVLKPRHQRGRLSQNFLTSTCATNASAAMLASIGAGEMAASGRAVAARFGDEGVRAMLLSSALRRAGDTEAATTALPPLAVRSRHGGQRPPLR